MSLRVVTWNVEWATPNSRRTAEVISRIDRHAPEVVCLTETHVGLLSPDGHTICSRPDYGYTAKEGRRKVMLWSREPWVQVDDVGSIRFRPDVSYPESRRHPWARSKSSECVSPGSGRGLNLGASWNVGCSGKIMNITWPA